MYSFGIFAKGGTVIGVGAERKWKKVTVAQQNMLITLKTQSRKLAAGNESCGKPYNYTRYVRGQYIFKKNSFLDRPTAKYVF